MNDAQHRDLERRFMVSIEQVRADRFELARRLTWNDDQFLPFLRLGPEVMRRIDTLEMHAQRKADRATWKGMAHGQPA